LGTGNQIRAINTFRGSKPGSMAINRPKLRNNSPAPIISASDNANSATTNALRK
jgi:hypothetical protein